MPKPSTGTVRVLVHDSVRRWHAKWTLADGTRTPWRPIDPNLALDDEAGAKACAARMAPSVRREGAPVGASAETCDAYFERLSLARKAEGIGGVRKEKYDWGKWVSPRIGSRPITAVTRDEIEDVRNALDAEVKLRLAEGLEAGLSGKSAMNVWSTLRTTFKETVSARDRALRVRTDDPTAGHKPPLATPARAKTFLFPNEVTKLLACEAVPVQWRQAYAVATYCYVRPEELEALTWDDVDFEAGTISVSKAIDARTGKAKPMPKTANAVREVPIEPTLKPLLVSMHAARSSDEAPVLPVLRTLNDKFRAKLLRAHLTTAGVKRARLASNTLTLMGVNFRSCRDSGITWLVLAGVPLASAQRRAGHQDVSQTLAYVKLAEDLSGTIGEPFPTIPASVLAESPRNRPGRFLPSNLAGKLAFLSAGGGSRTDEPEAVDHPEKKPDRAPVDAVESSTSAPVRDAPARGDAEARANVNPVDDAIASALARASAAGQWGVVETLARELAARRAAREARPGAKVIALRQK